MHEPLKHLNLTHHHTGRSSEDLALQIEAAILDGILHPGDRLPSERDLQTQYGSGRGVIREALAALKEKGLIEIRKGSKGGAFVKEMDLTRVSANLAIFLKQHRFSARQLIEFRESIDRPLASLAIARGEDKEKQQLVDTAKQLLEAVSDDNVSLEAIVELDRALNVGLARMAKNPIFEWIIHALQTGYSSYDFRLYEDPEFKLETAANWLETAIEVQARDPHAALSRIGFHYVLLRECLSKHGDIVGGDALNWARSKKIGREQSAAGASREQA